MADQASVRDGNPGSATNGSPEGRVVGGIAELGNDIATLVELQAKLFTIDMKECLGKLLIPVSLLGGGLVLLLGAVPVALLGIATLLASATALSPGWAMFLTGLVALALAAALMVVAAMRIGPSLSSFTRSSEELTRNLAWIRTVLVHSGRQVPRRRF